MTKPTPTEAKALKTRHAEISKAMQSLPPDAVAEWKALLSKKIGIEYTLAGEVRPA